MIIYGVYRCREGSAEDIFAVYVVLGILLNFILLLGLVVVVLVLVSVHNVTSFLTIDAWKLKAIILKPVRYIYM